MFKKVYVVLLVAVLTAGYAQAQVAFGVRAGFNLTNVGGDAENNKMKPGIQIGAVADFSLSESFSIQPGLLYAMQGCKFDYGGGEESEKLTLNYLQVPINAQYKIDLSGAKLLLQAGPYLGFGLGGKAKVGDESETLKMGSGDDKFCKAFDFGLGVGAGLQFSSFQVGLGYNIGLANISNDDGSKIKNNGLALTLTYLFGK